jgi:hypothetical protein
MALLIILTSTLIIIFPYMILQLKEGIKKIHVVLLVITHSVLIALMITLFSTTIEIEIKKAYKNSLISKNPYKMEILYKMNNDSILIPYDTIFTKIK